jgi:hypothetical protein
MYPYKAQWAINSMFQLMQLQTLTEMPFLKRQRYFRSFKDLIEIYLTDRRVFHDNKPKLIKWDRKDKHLDAQNECLHDLTTMINVAYPDSEEESSQMAYDEEKYNWDVKNKGEIEAINESNKRVEAYQREYEKAEGEEEYVAPSEDEALLFEMFRQIICNYDYTTLMDRARV